MKPLLAHVYEPHRVTYPCYVQPKLNGVRALYQNGRFQSRDGVPFPATLLKHLADPLLQTFDPRVILDGELYIHGTPLQEILGGVTPVRQEVNEMTLKVEYHVFDVVDFNLPFLQRMKAEPFAKLRTDMGMVRHVTTIHAHDEAYANEYYAHWVALDYEGMMYRLGDCPYTVPKQPVSSTTMSDGSRGSIMLPRNLRFLSDKDNRCWHLLKRKDWQDDEFLCIGMKVGEGKYAGTLGALVCKTKEGRTFTVSGFTDIERDTYWENQYPIGRQIKVKYLVLSTDLIPLNPTVIAVL